MGKTGREGKKDRRRQPEAGSESIGEALKQAGVAGTGRPPATEEVRIGETLDKQLGRDPVTPEAREYLNSSFPGTERLICYLPPHMLIAYARAAKRQLTVEDVRLLVGLDGDINSATCSFTTSDQIKNAETRKVKDQLQADLGKIDSLSDNHYPSEVKKRLKADLERKAEKAITEIESQGTRKFTPVFWIDPRINKLLIEWIVGNGGDILGALIELDLEHRIIRSGCFYDTPKGLQAYSGAPWVPSSGNNRNFFFLSPSPLGRIAVVHPRAGNQQDKIFAFRSGDHSVWTLNAHWGCSNGELERLKLITARRTESSSVAQDEVEMSYILGADDLIRELAGFKTDTND